ncbi:MAG TPA: UbiA-like polyprenyltransferase [Bacteroidales bacterium]|nr:UbiA-like polyprenyltransferase [Bacteroidales bacterium]HOK74511.1 UbiA-like polyprenyltransferase [Bacteroidales bacterium]HOM41153.1 UbiA-like polyprenyltransferase [Bacteroidales bacterium]HPP93528.1 UbiA-like polyprenyltransferase [Bacteroidales bacterium]HQG57258.1 UbiA-like polyprenyltransferase [Bacteroidales bacterium]
MKQVKISLSRYFSFVKFSHTVFALPFAISGYFLAISREEYSFSLRILLLVVLCMVFARNAAMGFNRYADEKFDAMNPRTASREIPVGIISKKSALIFVVINSILFIISAGLINRLTLILSPVALFIILGYSLTKRFTVLCHFILGLSLSLAPTGAYISVTGRFDLLPVIYSFIVLTWVSGFDIIYSLQDDEFDRSMNLHSIPALTGRKKGLSISMILHVLTILFVIAAGIAGRSGILFWAGAAIFILLLIYQHIIVRPHDISRVNLAFATTNGIASIIFAIFVITDLFVKI